MIKAVRNFAVCLALAGCSHQAASNEPQLTSTVVTESAMAEVNETVTPAMLLGHWGDDGDCSNDIVIGADGAFRSHANGAGTWVLNGNMLTMTTSATSSQVWVGTIGTDQLIFANQDRSAHIWRRCP